MRSMLVICLILLALAGGYIGWNSLITAGNELYYAGGGIGIVLLAVLVLMFF